jgi:uncharacterized protein (DUF2237 family)
MLTYLSLVAGGRLSLFSKDPPVGYYKDGYCRSDGSDSGNHTVAAVVSQGFLDFTNGKGNSLSLAGVKSSMKWCLCAARWKEAMEAAKAGELKKEDVPKVYVHATHERTLEIVSYKALRAFYHEGEVPGRRGRQDGTIDPSSMSNTAKHSQNIGALEQTGGILGSYVNPKKER